MSTLVNVALLVALGLFLVAPLVIRAVQRRFDPFEPVVVFALAYGTMFIVRPAAMLLDSRLAYERTSRTVDVAGTFTPMLVLALVGACAYAVGYGAPWGARLAGRLSPARSIVRLRASVIAAVGTGLLGVTLFVLFVQQAGGWAGLRTMLEGRSVAYYELIAQSNKYLYFGPWLLVPSALALLALGVRFRRPALLFAAAVFSLVLLFRSVPIGSRITLLPMLGGLFVLSYVMRNARPRLRLLLPALALAVVVSAVIGTWRNSDDRQRVRTSLVTQAVQEPALAFRPLTHGPDNAMAAVFAAGMTVVPSVTGYWHGRAVLGDLLVRPVPRQLWPDKPTPPRIQVVSLLWPRERPGTIANPEFSVVFLLFMDFGAVGVAAGMALLGVACRALFEYFRRHPGHLPVQVLYAMSLPLLVIAVRDSPVDTASRTAFTLLPAWLIFHVGARPRD